MNKKTTIVIGISMCFLFAFSTISTVIFPYITGNNIITFHPSEMMSYPGQIAWLLAEVENTENSQFEVKTRDNVPIEWNTWYRGNSSYLVEIFITPSISNIGSEIDIKLITTSESRVTTIGRYSLDVINWTSSTEANILAIRDHFIHYIETNTTFSNLNSSTTWSFCGSPAQILIVEHYLFRSEYWEIEVSRHVMIAPHDWVQIYIRPRNNTSPIWSARINSWSTDNTSIFEIAPPSEVFR
jgi:hypothetical protein